MGTHLSEVTTTATLAEKKKLRKGFRHLDMICYTVVAVIGLNALGAFASNGRKRSPGWCSRQSPSFFPMDCW
jgi:hypothetical protein